MQDGCNVLIFKSSKSLHGFAILNFMNSAIIFHAKNKWDEVASLFGFLLVHWEALGHSLFSLFYPLYILFVLFYLFVLSCNSKTQCPLLLLPGRRRCVFFCGEQLHNSTSTI